MKYLEYVDIFSSWKEETCALLIGIENVMLLNLLVGFFFFSFLGISLLLRWSADRLQKTVESVGKTLLW